MEHTHHSERSAGEPTDEILCRIQAEQERLGTIARGAGVLLGTWDAYRLAAPQERASMWPGLRAAFDAFFEQYPPSMNPMADGSFNDATYALLANAPQSEARSALFAQNNALEDAFAAVEEASNLLNESRAKAVPYSDD